MSNYGLSVSPINDGVCGPVKETEYRLHVSNIKDHSVLPSDDFERLFRQVCHKVDRIYSTGQHDLVFKGTWYTCVLVENIKRAADGRRFSRNKLETRLLSSLTLTLNYCDPWTEHFRVPIRKLIHSVGM